MTEVHLNPRAETVLRPLIRRAEQAVEARDFAESERQLQAALKAAEALRPPDASAVNTILAHYATLAGMSLKMREMEIKAGSRLGRTYCSASLSEVEEMRARALKGVAAAPAGESAASAQQLATLAMANMVGGRRQEGIALLKRALSLLENDRKAHPGDMASVLTQLGTMHSMEGQAVEAEAELRRAIGILERVAPNEPARRAAAMALLAGVLGQQGRHADAEAEARAGLALIAGTAGSEKQESHLRHELALALRRRWRLGEAAREFRRYLALERASWKGLGMGSWPAMCLVHWLMFAFAPRPHGRLPG